MGELSPELNADVNVVFDLDEHIVTMPLKKLLELLEINVENEKLIKVLKKVINPNV